MKPWLWLPAGLAHDLSPLALKCYSALRSPYVPEWQPLQWRGLRFANRLGLAGGVDKNASSVKDWWTLGPGFLEIGTVTPEPQGPNPGKIIGRDPSRRALWNRMGFPSKGMAYVARRLEALRPYQTPVFVNIGKNRTTANDKAHLDYIQCVRTLSGLADAFVINISSPNTKGLRELQSEELFARFLAPILDSRKETSAPDTPVLLKLSPDIGTEELEKLLSVSYDLGIDGWILTNTTTVRDPGDPFPNEGGMSGGPLSEKSKSCLRHARNFLGARKGDRLLISAGGVLSPMDVFERLEIGADLVQTYSALIFEGPLFFKKVAQAATQNP